MTNKKTEALKLALKKAFDLGKRYWQQANSDFISQWRKADVTLASFNQHVEDTIRDALAERPAQDQGQSCYCPECERLSKKLDAIKAQQQEPVATLWQHGKTGRTRITTPDEITDCDARWFKAADLYTHPTVIDKSAAVRIATALGWEPKREWVGLTVEEVDELRSGLSASHADVRAIEAKLKEKNT